jgi:hypothetical protein
VTQGILEAMQLKERHRVTDSFSKQRLLPQLIDFLETKDDVHDFSGLQDRGVPVNHANPVGR